MDRNALYLPLAIPMCVGGAVNYLPHGFLVRAQRHCETGEHLIYSDGLAIVSVYIEQGTGNDEKTSASRVVAVHARSFVKGANRIFLIGKVPSETIERFARGVVARGVVASTAH